MKAIVAPTPGDESALIFVDRETPKPAADEVLISVAATALNRADVLQRQGHYPPPAGVTDILGLECAGVVSAVGSAVTTHSPGDRVCALLPGGGYAEQVSVPAGQVLPVPTGMSLTDAASLPEGLCTVWSNLSLVAGLQSSETVLIHGGAGGIGTFALQVSRHLGATVITTVGSDEKGELCKSIGADQVINYRTENFVEVVKKVTDGQGVNVVLDIIGAKYLADNVRALGTGGRLVVIGLQGGVKAELNLGSLLMKQGSIYGTSLRASTLAYKAQLVADVHARLWPAVQNGTIRPLVDRILPWEEVQKAHRLMANSDHCGKIVLTVDASATTQP